MYIVGCQQNPPRFGKLRLIDDWSCSLMFQLKIKTAWPQPIDRQLKKKSDQETIKLCIVLIKLCIKIIDQTMHQIN